MNKADKLLIKSHIFPGYKGYEYIKWILLNEKDSISQIKITAVYDIASKYFKTSGQIIERSIRTVIDKSNLKGKSNKIALALLQLEYMGAYKNDLIEISKANIDWAEGESQAAMQRKLEMTETEKRINEKVKELGWIE